MSMSGLVILAALLFLNVITLKVFLTVIGILLAVDVVFTMLAWYLASRSKKGA